MYAKYKKGDCISFIIYYGDEEYIAQSLYEQLQLKNKSNIPVQITNTEVEVRLTEVLIEKKIEMFDYKPKYIITIRGVLI